jgi:exopolysaccharide biosynthesis polyprenyl glycosylphosphotransferase
LSTHLDRSTSGSARLRKRRFAREVGRWAATPASAFLVESRPRPGAQRRDRVYRLGLLGADVAASLLVVAFVVLWLQRRGPEWTALVLAVLVPAVNSASRLYQRDERVLNKSTLEEAPALLQSAAVVTVLAFLVESGLLAVPMGAVVVGSTWAGLVVLLPLCRAVTRAVVRDVLPPERCLVLGDHEHGHRLAAKLAEQAGVKAELVGIMPLPDPDDDGGARELPPVLRQLAEAVDAEDVDRVVIAAGQGEPQQELETIQAAKALGVKVSVLPRVLEVVGRTASYDYVDGLTVLGVPRFGLSAQGRAVKRAFDVAGSLGLLVVFSPLMALISLAIKLTSPGPLLFRQVRVGRGGEQFEVLKFRSMYEGAERVKDKLRDRNEADGLFKIADDPRITPVGRVLRRTSLDELPQLMNVVRGEMSLVGPRPLVPEEDRQIQGWHRRRLQLTPGMTGPWQVLGSARIPLREMVTIDYLYVANWSLWEDIKVLIRTAAAVAALKGR